MTLADAYTILKRGSLWSASGRCKGFAVANPGEAAKIDAYVAALTAAFPGGQQPVPPVLATDTGRGLVGMLAALAPTSAPAPSPSPTPGLIFEDTFEGPAGSPPNPANWVNLDGIDWGPASKAKAANAYLDGAGHLVLRVVREPWLGKAFSGAVVASYQYQTGWPPQNIKHSWPVPFRYECRVLFPDVDSAWVGPGWLQNVDRPNTQSIYELDCGETISTNRLIVGANQHTWLSGKDVAGADGAMPCSDNRLNWHTVAVEARADSCRYFVDGVLGQTHYGVSGRFGVMLHNAIGDKGFWAFTEPDPADPGPWEMLVDYVRVTAL